MSVVGNSTWQQDPTGHSAPVWGEFPNRDPTYGSELDGGFLGAGSLSACTDRAEAQFLTCSALPPLAAMPVTTTTQKGTGEL